LVFYEYYLHMFGIQGPPGITLRAYWIERRVLLLGEAASLEATALSPARID
jgi:hypothetical protein